MTDGEVAPRGRKRNSPGRPGGPSVVKEEILDAAEQRFADHGYAGTSLRDIVTDANVTQALVNYYFGSKKGLFVAVYLRRGLTIAEARADRLGALKSRGDGVTIEEIVHAYLSPAFDMRNTVGGRAFIRLQSRIHTEPMELAYELRRTTYDQSTQTFVELLALHLPHLSRKTLYWRLVQTIGAYLYMISDAHRIDELSAGTVQSGDVAEELRQLVTFTAGGLQIPDR